jgi:hypothetical protein
MDSPIPTLRADDPWGPPALAAAGTAAASGVLAPLGVPLEFLVAVLVVPVLVTGPRTAVGGSFGLLLSELWTGSVGPWTLPLCVWTAGLPYAVLTLRTGGPAGAAGVRSRRSSLRTAARSFVAGLVAVVCATATVAWSTALLGAQPYLTTLWTYLAAGVAAVTVATLARHVGREAGPVSPRADAEPTVGRRTLLALFAVGSGWFVLGTGLATLTHDVRLLRSAPAVETYAGALAGGGTLGEVATEFLLVLYADGDLLVVGLGGVGVLALAALWPTVAWRDRARSAVSRVVRDDEAAASVTRNWDS